MWLTAMSKCTVKVVLAACQAFYNSSTISFYLREIKTLVHKFIIETFYSADAVEDLPNVYTGVLQAQL